MVLQSERFPWKRFLKSLAMLAIPVALQNLLTTTGSMIDTMMLAVLGETTVGAVGLCAQFTSLIFSGYWGFIGGGMLFFSQYWGAKDEDGIDRAYGVTLVFVMSVAALATCSAIFFPDFIMRVYTDKANIQTIGINYLQIVGFAYPLQLLSMAMSSLLRSTERVRIPLYAAIASVLTNITLNFLLITGRWIFPALGVQGAAIATVVANAVNVVIIYTMARAQKFPFLFHIRKHFCWTKPFLQEYLRKCFPILCNEALIGVGNMVINMVLGRQTEQAIAAIAVFRTLEGLVIGFFAGFSNASSVLVGKNIGSGNLRVAYERAKRLVYLCAATIFLLCLLLVVFNKPILTAMSLSGESLQIGFGLLLIYCIVAVIRMSNWVQNDTYRSSGDAAYGTILELAFMYALVLPCVSLSGLVFKAPFFLVFSLCYVDEPIRFILMQRHLYSCKWIKPVTPQGKAALPVFMQEMQEKRKRIRQHDA